MIIAKQLFLFGLFLTFFLFSVACGPKAIRGGPGTNNAKLDEKALSTKLDRLDLQYLIDQNLNALFNSVFWKREIDTPTGSTLPVVTIFAIENNTAEHMDDEMVILLSSIETSLVNSGLVNVVSRERQNQMISELGMQQSMEMDAATAGKMGKQLGAKYYITGKLGAVAERMKKMRRMQYNLFLQVLDVETSMVKFQHETVRSKAVK